MLGSAKLQVGGMGEGPGVGGDGGDTGGQENVRTHWPPWATYMPVAYEPSGQAWAMAGTGSPEQSTVAPELELVMPPLELDPELPVLEPELDPEPDPEPELPPSPVISPGPGWPPMTAPEHAAEATAATRAAHETRIRARDMTPRTAWLMPWIIHRKRAESQPEGRATVRLPRSRRQGL